MKKRDLDYVEMQMIGALEYGFALTETAKSLSIEVVVMDHDRHDVRIIGEASCLKEAKRVLDHELANGLVLHGVPSC